MHELFLDIVVLTYMAMFFGFLVDIIFPTPNPREPFHRTFALLWIQILVDALICVFVAKGWEQLVDHDPDEYYAFTIFTVVFFLVQTQLFDRLTIFYHTVTGRILK